MNDAASLPALEGCRVLVAEDEFLVAEEVALALGDAGAEVLGPVASVEDALALLAGAARIDGAVLDLNLRGEACFPVADALSERGVPFVFATGYGASAIPPRYAGVRRCEKPVEPAAIARALRG